MRAQSSLALFFLLINIDSGELLKRDGRNERNQRVQFMGRILILVTLARQANTNSIRHIAENESLKRYQWLKMNAAYRTPFDQMNLLTRVSIRTSFVPICFSANLRISLIARGARFLKPLKSKQRLNARPHRTYMLWMYL